MANIYSTIRIKSWEDLQKLYFSNKAHWKQWRFRGQSLSSWDLRPSIEIVCRDRFRKSWKLIPEIEQNIIREFKRNFHRYSSYLPKDDDRIEWIAFMQHHGAPTRLLDWTYSFYVALFFAIKQAQVGQSCAVWAIDHQWSWDRLRLLLPQNILDLIDNDPLWNKSPETHKALLNLCQPLVVPLNSYYQNERHSIQQGIFLAPLDLTKPFMENLKAFDTTANIRKHIIKIVLYCNKAFLHDALDALNRMNINRKSLFPGLDGFAKNLENLVGLHLGIRQPRSGIIPP